MTRSELLANLPPLPTDDLSSNIREALENSERSIVVLDNSPSGTQSVFDVPVLTDLSPDSVRDAIDQAPPLLFILTQAQTLSSEDRASLYQNLGQILKEYADEIILISRSNFIQNPPSSAEADILKEALNIPEAPTLLIPFSEADGHLSIKQQLYSTHENDTVNEHSPFPEELPFISIKDLRSSDLSKKLASLEASSTYIVNASSLRDLDALSLALHQSERRFILHSASSFLQSFAGIISRPPLDSWQMQDLEPNPNGGLIISGSHLPKSRLQLNHLIKNAPDLTAIKLSIPDILHQIFDPARCASEIDETLSTGQSIVLFSSRKPIANYEDAAVSHQVSQTLIRIVKAIKNRPSFILIKGSSTSAQIATHALGVKQAQVLGQILPGVPVWTIGNETLHPGLAYIVFPGNIGDETSLTQAHQKLTS